MRQVTWVMLLLWSAACGKAPLDLDSVPQPGLAVTPASLTFPPTFVGETSGLPMVISVQSPWAKEVELFAEGPYRLDRVRLPPGEQKLHVFFTPLEHGSSEGTLYIKSGDFLAGRVPLSGLGRDRSLCANVGPCETSAMELESGICLVEKRPDGASCTSECIEAGVCQAGACTGTRKPCDDGNACTADFCDDRVGCRALPRVDGITCGAGSCEAMPTCLAGSCVVGPARDRLACAIDAAYPDVQGECQSQQCEPVMMYVAPRWTYAASAAVVHDSGVADAAGNVYFVQCAGTGCDLVSLDSAGETRYRAPLGEHLDGTGREVQTLLEGDTVLVAFPDGTLRARRASDGSAAWGAELGADLGSGLLTADGRGRVWFAAAGPVLRAVTLANGAWGESRTARGTPQRLATDGAGGILLETVGPAGRRELTRYVAGVGASWTVAMESASLALAVADRIVSTDGAIRSAATGVLQRTVAVGDGLRGMVATAEDLYVWRFGCPNPSGACPDGARRTFLERHGLSSGVRVYQAELDERDPLTRSMPGPMLTSRGTLLVSRTSPNGATRLVELNGAGQVIAERELGRYTLTGAQAPVAATLAAGVLTVGRTGYAVERSPAERGWVAPAGDVGRTNRAR